MHAHLAHKAAGGRRRPAGGQGGRHAAGGAPPLKVLVKAAATKCSQRAGSCQDEGAHAVMITGMMARMPVRRSRQRDPKKLRSGSQGTFGSFPAWQGRRARTAVRAPCSRAGARSTPAPRACLSPLKQPQRGILTLHQEDDVESHHRRHAEHGAEDFEDGNRGHAAERLGACGRGSHGRVLPCSREARLLLATGNPPRHDSATTVTAPPTHSARAPPAAWPRSAWACAAGTTAAGWAGPETGPE